MTSQLLLNAAKQASDIIQGIGGLYPLSLIKKRGETRTRSTRRDLSTIGDVKGSASLTHSSQGMLFDSLTLREQTTIKDVEAKILVIAHDLGDGIVPEPTDEISIDGKRYIILRVESNQARVSYMCYVKKK